MTESDVDLMQTMADMVLLSKATSQPTRTGSLLPFGSKKKATEKTNSNDDDDSLSLSDNRRLFLPSATVLDALKYYLVPSLFFLGNFI